MKTKALIFAITAIFGASTASASLRSVRCDITQKQTVVSAVMYDGDDISVVIDGVNPSAGDTVVSVEDIKGKFWKSTSVFVPAGSGRMTFRINSEDQNQAVVAYTFEYYRSGESSAPASTCLVNIQRK